MSELDRLIANLMGWIQTDGGADEATRQVVETIRHLERAKESYARFISHNARSLKIDMSAVSEMGVATPLGK